MGTDCGASKYTEGMQHLELIKSSENIILTTHINSDGDGLGSEVAMYHALKKINKNPQIIHNDRAADRYQFLFNQIEVWQIEDPRSQHFLEKAHLALIFDTHDEKLCRPLFTALESKQIPTLYVDHHVPVYKTSSHTHFMIDENATCTGEIVQSIIEKLNIPMDQQIAQAIYASLMFDTQCFKFIRNSAKPFLMAEKLLKYDVDHAAIQKKLFETWSVSKINFLAHLITQVEYLQNQKIAVLRIHKKDLEQFHLQQDQANDVIDFFMNIQSLQIAIVVREFGRDFYKLSFRSRSDFSILPWAQAFGGGGHLSSAGAWVQEPLAKIEEKLNHLFSTEI